MADSRIFVIGDIHGAYTALMQCLSLSEFDYQQDMLIALGDVCDGWPETAQCINELLKIERLAYVLGNHDLWALEWAREGISPEIWLQQGGQATLDAYPTGMPVDHRKFLSRAHLYFIYQEKLFVHAGILPDIPIKYQEQDVFLWDRSLCNLALRQKQQGRESAIGTFSEIYIGHTPTIRYGSAQPINSGNVWMMDTGAAWNGRLTIMDIQSKEYFQSDPVEQLYPGVKGR